MGLRDITLGVLVGGSLAAGAVYAQDKIKPAVLHTVAVSAKDCKVEVQMGLSPADTDLESAFGEKLVRLRGRRPGCAAVKAWLDNGFLIEHVPADWPAAMPLPWPKAP